MLFQKCSFLCILSLFWQIMNRAYPYTAYKYTGYSLPKTYGLLEKYPEDIQCVYPSSDPERGAIYVSNVEAASNFKTLSKFNIKAVMTCAKGYDKDVPKSKLDMFEYFPFDDKQTCSISPFFQRGSDFISNALSKTNILVHCIAGVSRSVSMVLAYLIRDKGMSYQDAYHTVKSRRSITQISPNDGFIRQLKQYAAQIRNRMNMGRSETFVRQKSPNRLRQNESYTPPKVSQNKTVYASTIKKSQTIYKKSRGIQNQEDNTLIRGRTDAWINTDKNQSSPIEPSNQQAKKNSGDLYLTKSSTFGSTNASKTPQKVSKNESYKKQIQTTPRPRTAYFEQMNRQLNEKIQAIHAKYEKQRETLLAKRGLGSAAKEERSQSYAILNKDGKKDLLRYPGYTQSTKIGSRNINRYANAYDSKYGMGLNYNFDRLDRLGTNSRYYKSRYYF